MLENDDVRSQVVTGATSSGELCIRFCDEHYAQQEALCEKFHRTDEGAFLRTHHTITTLATRTLGTDAVVAAGCPVCALQKFDYLGELIPIILGHKDS